MATLPNFVDWDAIPARPLFPGVSIRVFSSAQVMLSLVDMAPGAVIPSHQHPHEQLGIWLRGEAAAVVRGTRHTLHASESYYIPGDTPHSFTIGTEGAQALDVFNPPREDYL